MSALAPLSAFDSPALPVPAGDGASFAVRLAGKYQGRVTGHFVQPGREGRYAPLPEDLPERLAAALRARGVEQLYAHQAQAWEAVNAGGHVVLATPTASGKSLCYTLPVVSGVMTRKAKSLYLLPTMAMSQDQVASLMEYIRVGYQG